MPETRRPVSPGLERILFDAFPVLDHGYVMPVDYMGTDAEIAHSARVSYGRGTRAMSDDRGLIRYLMRHRHTSPFEMCEVRFEVKMPIFVARQWLRHRTANVNEYSARYSILDREFYLPEPDKVAMQSTTNNQGRGDVLSPDQAETILDMMKRDAQRAFDTYDLLLNVDEEGNPKDNEHDPVARELARIGLPLSTYTSLIWKVDLHNLFHFLGLRADPHAQYEIRAYAERMLDIVGEWVPEATAAFREYMLGGFHLSAGMVKALRRMKQTGDMEQPQGMSGREWRELMAMLEGPIEG